MTRGTVHLEADHWLLTAVRDPRPAARGLRSAADCWRLTAGGGSHLNPFIPEEKALQGRGSRQQLQAEITAVELADGTKIALLKEIPEDADGQ